MTEKRIKTVEIVDQIGTTWLTDRWISLIADVQRDVAEILSDFDPMWSENIFSKLRDAILARDTQAVNNVLDTIYQFNVQMSEAREILLDLRAAIKSVPEVYGGNGSNDQ